MCRTSERSGADQTAELSLIICGAGRNEPLQLKLRKSQNPESLTDPVLLHRLVHCRHRQAHWAHNHTHTHTRRREVEQVFMFCSQCSLHISAQLI